MSRLRGLVVVAFAGGALFCCSTESSTSGGGSGGVAGAEGGSSTFASSPCFSCLEQACAAEQSACGSDPGCASFLDCSKGCPTDPSGYVSKECQSACPVGDTSSAQKARTVLLACQQSGPGAACTECGFSTDAGTPANAALNQQCGPSSWPDVCDRCLFEKCCDSMDAVMNAGPTKDLFDCWYDCKDYACEKACSEKYPEGISAFGGWGTCVGVKCIGPGDCPSQGGPCGMCSYQSCGVELADCTTNSDCFLARECSGNCTTPECVSACRDANPNGLTLFDALAVCLQVKCTTSCGHG